MSSWCLSTTYWKIAPEMSRVCVMAQRGLHTQSATVAVRTSDTTLPCHSGRTMHGTAVPTVWFLSQVLLEQKRFDSNLKVITEKFIHSFISALDRTITTVYSNLTVHPYILLKKLQRAPFEKQPSRAPTSITNYHTKVSQHTTLHYTESLHRRSSAAWLKSSSPEFPQLVSDQSGWRQSVSKTPPEVKLCLGRALFSGWERLLRAAHVTLYVSIARTCAAFPRSIFTSTGCWDELLKV